MRTSSRVAVSERDRQSIREFLEQEAAEAEQMRLTADREQYRIHHSTLEDVGITFDAFRALMPSDEPDAAARATIALNKALLRRVRTAEAAEAEASNAAAKQAIATGKKDPTWKIPASVAGLKMSIEQAKKYNQEQAAIFASENPEYYGSPKNYQAIVSFLERNGVQIADSETFKSAWLRLRSLGLIEERPAAPVPSTPEPAPQPEPVAESEEELVQGWDLATGQPKKFNRYEVGLMDSETYRRTFRVNPRFTRSYFGDRT